MSDSRLSPLVPGSGANILVIDDMRTFNFRATYARTSKAALRMLKAAPPSGYDEVWFDHDLGGPDDIGPVVSYLEERAYFDDALPIGLVIVHSSNPVGAARTFSTLDRYYRALRVDAKPYLVEVRH